MVTSLIRHLNGAIGVRTIERWCKIIRKTDLIDLSKQSGRPCVLCSKEIIQKIKTRLKLKKRVSSRKLTKEFDISERSVRLILKGDLGLRPYQKQIELLLSKIYQTKRVMFANWIREIISEKSKHNANPIFR